MNQPLLPKSNDSDFINSIRQSYINQQTHANDEEVKNFLKKSLKYLKNDLSFIEANELFSTILLFFSYNTKIFSSFFPHLLKRSRTNSNFIIITSLTISDIIYTQPTISVPDYQSFVSDAINEIIPQIQEINKKPLELFGHEISPYFNTSLIVSLLIASNLTDKLFLSFFPYLYYANLLSYDPKVSLLLQNVSKLGVISILSQTETSNEEINEFIKQKGHTSLYDMSIQSVSLIESVIVFIKCKEKKKIKGLKKETILQFLAVLIVIIKNYQIQDEVKFSAKVLLDLLLEGAKYIQFNNIPVLNTSINLIISNYFYINGTLSIPSDTIIELFDILLSHVVKNRYNGDKMILFLNIFDLFIDKIKYYNFRNQIMEFNNQNKEKFTQLILNNLTEINNDYRFKQRKLDLKYLNKELLLSRITENQIMSFIDNCCDISKKEVLGNSVEVLKNALLFNIREHRWDTAIFITLFLKKNYIISDVKLSIILNDTPTIHEKIFGHRVTMNETADEIIDHILSDQYPELNNQLIRHLFNKMVQNKDILKNYLFYLLSNDSGLQYFTIDNFISTYYVEYGLYKDDFADAVKKMFVYKADKNLLFFRMGFEVENEKLSIEFGNNIVLKLLDKVKSKPDNYQAYYCLMNIASCFPFLFIHLAQEIFEIVLPSFEYISYIFERRKDDISVSYIKTAYISLHFLASILQSSIILDKFYIWAFKNIINFSNAQVLCIFIILNVLNQDKNIQISSQALIFSYNFLDIVSQLLKREINEGLFRLYYKNNIYKFLTETFSFYSKCDIYVVTQIDELRKLESPIYYFFNKIFMSHPKVNRDSIDFEDTDQLSQFFKTIKDPKDFWLSFDFENLRFKQPRDDLIRKLTGEMKSNITYSENSYIPKIKRPFTMHMIRYIVTQKNWFYEIELFNTKIPITNDSFNYFFERVNKANNLRDYADKHPDEDDESDISLYSVDDYLLPQYCQDSLIKSLMNDVSMTALNDKSISSLTELFKIYISNNIALLSFFTVISQTLCEMYEKCIGYASPSSLKAIYNLIDILVNLLDVKNFKENFFEACGNNTFNIILSHELRSDPILLWKYSNLLSNFDNLPIYVIQLIRIMLLLNNEKVTSSALLLSSKFTHDELKDVNDLILLMFDKELANERRLSMVWSFIEYYPLIFELRQSKILSILKGLFKKLSESRSEKTIDSLSFLLNKLAPKRVDFNSISSITGDIYQIPQHVKDTFPAFWNIIEENIGVFMQIILPKPSLLNKFHFLLDYPELTSFRARSSYFRTNMKKKIDNSHKLVLQIDSENILASSFQNLIDETTENILQKFYVVFLNNTSTIDMGGPTREWFTKLAKEIFNQNYALFDCLKSISYQPSSISYIHDDFLQHFRFVGIFIARALIEGQCIDAHLTTSFLKQILHREPDFKDLQDVDEELYNSLNWMLNNDVDPLEMYFEIDFEEFGVHKTIPLKENGSEIKVTNDNKKEFVDLNSQFALKKKIEVQVNAFCQGFDSLISPEEIRFFSPNELDLLICGVPDIDAVDFMNHCVFEHPYTAETPVIKMFFNVIKKWDNENLAKLLLFMTGSSRIPANGFKEFCEMTGFPLRIACSGDEQNLPQAHTCFNTIDLPPYRSEKELNDKLLYAIQECNTFGMI